MQDRVDTGLLSISVAGVAALCVVSSVAGGVLPQELPSGQSAVETLGERLDDTAVRNELTPEGLRELLLSDDSLRVDGAGDLLYVCRKAPDPDARETTDATETPGRTMSAGDVFTLHSNPGASKVIYLDFDGHHSVNNAWNHNIMFPPYDVNGNPDEFSTVELTAIQAWFDYVEEDFAPFDVDVTTEDPGVEALRRSGGGDDNYGIRCVITQATQGFGDGIGGVAFLNSFDDSVDNPCFAFNKGHNNGSMTVSHEVGHTLGLVHDGLDGSTYHPGCCGTGETSWGPIMGALFGRQCVHWSNGDYPGSTSTQDDVVIITRSSNGFDEFPDDHGDTVGTATVVDICPDPTRVNFEGLIELRTDVDAFRFESAAGQVRAIVRVLHPGHNIDLLIELLDSDGNLIVSANLPEDVDAAFQADVAAGEYILTVDGVGHPTNYSDYGCLGTYFVELRLPAASGSCDCPEDLNGSGAVDFGDILAILSAWGNAGGPEDLDASGTVDFQDVLVVLSAWGPC